MRVLSNPLVHKAVAAFALFAFAVQIGRFYLRPSLPKPWGMTDFDIFRLAGALALQGEYDKAYSRESFLPFHKAFTGVDSFLTWTYPPQFGLIAGPLAWLDVITGYVLFTVVTLGAYLFVLRKLAGSGAGAVVTLVFPAIVLTLLTGQNGFLTAALIGGSALLLMRNSPGAGVTLGLMAIKPHLAATLGVYCIASRNWPVVAAAAATVLATALVATFFFGFGIWTAFLNGVAETSAYLDRAAYPMHRMTSVYAVLRTTGFGANASFIGQIAVSLAAFALVVMIAVRRWPQRQALGMTVLLGLFISPYACDYDLPILGVAIALLLPELDRRATALEQTGLAILAWGAAFWGFGMQRAHQYAGAALTSGNQVPSLGGLFMLLLLALVWRIVRRKAATRHLEPVPTTATP